MAAIKQNNKNQSKWQRWMEHNCKSTGGDTMGVEGTEKRTERNFNG